MKTVVLAAATAFAMSATFAQANEEANLMFAAAAPKSEKSVNYYEMMQKLPNAVGPTSDVIVKWYIENPRYEYPEHCQWTTSVECGNVDLLTDSTQKNLLSEFLKKYPNFCEYAKCVPNDYDHSVLPDDTRLNLNDIPFARFEVPVGHMALMQ